MIYKLETGKSHPRSWRWLPVSDLVIRSRVADEQSHPREYCWDALKWSTYPNNEISWLAGHLSPTNWKSTIQDGFQWPWKWVKVTDEQSHPRYCLAVSVYPFRLVDDLLSENWKTVALASSCSCHHLNTSHALWGLRGKNVFAYS